jgi:hypothetical protein
MENKYEGYQIIAPMKYIFNLQYFLGTIIKATPYLDAITKGHKHMLHLCGKIKCHTHHEKTIVT